MTRQVPEPGQGIIMWKVIEKRMKEKMDGSMFIGTWWSLVPPLLAIVLAFLTKEVYSSLFFIYIYYTPFCPHCNPYFLYNLIWIWYFFIQ